MSKGVNWDYFDKFEEVNKVYLPSYGEGENLAEQICTAVTKLVYKWYNDGDVFDNSYYLSGWCNDLSSYANWLRKYTSCGDILDGIDNCSSEAAYEFLLKDLADRLLDRKYLDFMSGCDKEGSIYECDGPFEFHPDLEEDEDEYEYGYYF